MKRTLLFVLLALGVAGAGGVLHAQVTATKRGTLLIDTNANGKAGPGDTLRYTIVITNTSSSNLVNVQLNDLIQANQALVPGSIKSLPVARPDSYAAIGNTLLTVVAGSGVLVNDSDPDGDSLTASGSSSTSAQGGTVSVAANGSFTYLSAAGFTGTDTFSYAISDGNGGTSSSIVTVNVSERVWYVNNAGANGDGRQTSPFNSLPGAATASTTSDYIYLFQGSGNYTAGITLKNSQKLVGSGDALVVGATTVFDAGTRPSILAASGTGVTLGTDNIVHGLNIGSSSGRAISGATAGNLVISNVIASATGGAAVNLAAGTVSVTLDSVSSATSADNGINLSAINGSFVVNGGSIASAAGTDFVVVGGNGAVTYGGTINNTAGRSVDISGRTGGAVTLSGNITDTGTGVIVQNNTGGTTTFSGTTKTVNTGANPAVTLASNTGHTINFSNSGLDVDTTSAAAFSVAGGGTVNVTGSGNTINSTSGTTFLNSGTGGSAIIDINASLTGTGRLIDIQSRTGGDVTLSGNLNNSGGTGMLIQNNSGGGTIALSGTTKTFSTGANTAVNLANNTGTTINFTGGGLAITTTTATGFNATGGATAVNVTGTGNTIGSGTGTALNVGSTTIGASGLTFQSIAANGAASGIVLNNTGTTGGGLRVTGTGTADSGGIIQNTTGVGVSLVNAGNVILDRMRIANTGSHGVSGTGVSDGSAGVRPSFAFLNSLLDSPGDADNESALFFDTLAANNITGRLVVSNATIQNFEDAGVIVGNVSGSLIIDVASVIFDNNSDTTGEEGIDVDASGTANITLNVTGTPTGLPSSGAFSSTTRFINIEGGAINGVSQGSGVLDLNLTSVHITTGTPGGPDNFPTPPALTFSAEGTASTFKFDIINSRIDDSSGDGIFIGHEGTIEGRITGNTITNIALGDGIRIDTDTTSSSTVTILIQNNEIMGIGDQGIQVLHRDGTKPLNLTIDNNRIQNVANEGIRIFADDDVGGGGPLTRASITANTFANISPVNGFSAISLASQDPGNDIFAEISGNTGVNSIQLTRTVGLAGTPVSTLNIEQASAAALAAANGIAAGNVFQSGTITFNVPVTVPQPTNP